MTSNALFSLWPYLALIVLAAGLALRAGLAGSRPEILRPALSAAALARPLRMLWRGAAAVLLLGHLAGLVLPGQLLRWGTAPARLYLLEAAAFAAGLAALIAWLVLFWRQLTRPAASFLADLCDSLFASLILVGLASGLAVAALHRWGTLWGPVTLAPYARSVLRGTPEVAPAAGMPFLVQLHVFSAFAATAAFPFTQLAGRLVASVRRALAAARARAAAGGRRAEGWARRLNPAPWIWPDED